MSSARVSAGELVAPPSPIIATKPLCSVTRFTSSSRNARWTLDASFGNCCGEVESVS